MPQVLTRQKAREHIEREARGYEFPLPYTGGVYTADEASQERNSKLLGQAKIVARVRRLSLLRLAKATNLSPKMQSLVTEVFQEFEDGSGIRIRSWADIVKTTEQSDELTNGLCIAGFLEPQLVETEHEANIANNPAIVWVEEIDWRDRAAYRDLVMSGEEAAADVLKPFPDLGMESASTRQSVPIAAETFGGDDAAATWNRPLVVS